ncbi:histidine kinase [Leptospira fletcheri]|uniref:histidine kinase n=1 Tax=Leptospira fletcheri TaxID=2484981 RepID=A0A4V3JDU0_9LEPT|nr:ATP-binding protein [Leptospira fletcheri]TGK12035.1 histidine kinase [Leptospira fletcheri]
MFTLSYSQKLTIGFLLAVSMIAAIGGAFFWNHLTLAKAKSSEENTREIILKLESISSNIKDSEILAIRYAGANGAAFREDFGRSLYTTEIKIVELRILTRENPKQQERVRKLESLVHSLGDSALAAVPVNSPFWEKILGTLEEMKIAEKSLFQERAAIFQTRIDIGQIIILVFSVFNLFLLTALFQILKKESERRLNAEKNLSDQNSLLESILNNMADGVFAIDKKERIFLSNARILELVGSIPVLQEDWRVWIRKGGLTIARVDSPDGTNLEDSLVGIQEFFKKESSKFSVHVIKPGPEESILEVNVRLLKDRLGDPIGRVILLTEVTDRFLKERQIKELNLRLEKNLKKAENANRELEAFSYSVSHDLRSPIRGIDGFTKILVEDYSEVLDAEGNRLLGVIMKNTKVMGQLIDDLLEFYRISKNEPKSDPVDMNRLVRDCIVSLELNRATFVHDVQIAELSPAYGDSSMLKQVFMNLISNAFKYSSKKNGALVEIGGSIGDGENTYYVRDNGAGFDHQYAHKLFKIFQRLHSSDEFEGTGIGLAIVEKIVSRHGGRVWAEGEKNKGATFYFTLPSEV